MRDLVSGRLPRARSQVHAGFHVHRRDRRAPARGALRRAAADRARRIASFVYTKTGKMRHVPLTERALAAVAAIPELLGCPYVFHDNRRWQPWSDPILR